jgi:hypothetical protein
MVLSASETLQGFYHVEILSGSLPLVGKWIVWKIGNGRNVRLGEDPWLGAGDNFRLSEPLVQFLKNLNLFHLHDIHLGDPQLRGSLGWRDSVSLGLPQEFHVEWDSYISRLCENFILLDDESSDTLCWSYNQKEGSFTTKLGYKAWQEERLQVQPKWWWKTLWKRKAPLRCKISLWLAMNNKLLTWDNGVKRGWCGPNHCTLCFGNEESFLIFFLFVPMQARLQSWSKKN